MKTNQEYKYAALVCLRGNWAPAVVATIVYFLIGILSIGVDQWDSITRYFPKLAVFVPSTSGMKAFIGGCSLLFTVFILNPLSVGYQNSFRVLYENGDADTTSNMFHFALENYLHIVWGYFLMTLKILLWALLLIVPGIIMAYAYALTPYIMVEHPEMSASEAISESKRMMDGHKFDLFWLQLSFIGWFLLGLLTLGIGFIWLEPYASVSIVAFYEDLKAGETFYDIDGQ